ncbi:MAG: hypothetical protein NTW10_03460 [Bacteroidetes bacterium]|nr:hypothetical protein [Bacteroidota bacterium]
MKTKILIFPIVLMALFFMVESGCKKSSDDTTSQSNTVTDIDGNIYHMVRVGTQVWTVENLKTTKFNDGFSIALDTSATAWGLLTSPSSCYYNNDISNKGTYGMLYNWYAVNTGKLAMKGWHIPSNAERKILSDYLGGDTLGGGKMKTTGTLEAGTGLWLAPNGGATNESGFSAIPVGQRTYAGKFKTIGMYSFFWNSDEQDSDFAWSFGPSYLNAGAYYGTYFKKNGFSVRCVKN